MERVCRGFVIIFALFTLVYGQTEPQIKPVFDTYYIIASSTLELQCSAEGSNVNLAWYKNGTRIAEKYVEQVARIPANNEVPVKTAKLSIPNTSMTDSGTYECREQSSSQRQATIRVEVFGVDIVGRNFTKGEGNILLQCDPKFSIPNPQFELKWLKNHTEVTDENKYKVIKENHSLEIIKPSLSSAGEYSCAFTFKTKPEPQTRVLSVHLNGEPVVRPFEKSKNLIEGDRLDIICEISGHPQPVITWRKDGMNISDSRVMLKMHKGIADGRLIIEKVQFSDKGVYMCMAESEFFNTTNNSTLLVRVKDKLAALWPFLGIVAEVVILCVIIFIYEKRRSKASDEDDDVNSGQACNARDHKGNDEVRQRNVRT